MKRSTARILTTHTGSLPRPADLVALLNAKELGEAYDRSAYDGRVARAVTEIVARQAATGIDIVDDGEHSKVNWMAYARARLSGLDEIDSPPRFRGATRDLLEFPGTYEDMRVMLAARSGALVAKRQVRPRAQVCVGTDQIYRAGRARAGHREPEERDGWCEGRGSLHDGDLAVQSRTLLRKPLLCHAGGISRGARRRDACRIQGDCRCGPAVADRRSAHGDALQSRGRRIGRGVPHLHRAARRGGEPCAARYSGRARALPHLLQRQRRAARARFRAQAFRRPDAAHQRVART